jgi:hypothetical protein
MCDRDPGNDQTSIQGRKHEPYTEIPNSVTQKKERQVKSRVKSISISSSGLFTKMPSGKPNSQFRILL